MTPDYCEPLIGWRIWHVGITRGGGQHLQSCAQFAQWEPFQKMTATHADAWGYRDDEFSCGGPATCGSCGIYAFKSDAALRHGVDVSVDAIVIGKVALWGAVAVHKQGYRAQYAYPSEFVYAENCDGPALARTYGIPFTEDSSWTSDISSARSSWNRWPSPLHSYVQNTSPILAYLHAKNLSAWSSPYLCRPQDHSLIVEPPVSAESVVGDWPGLPRGMVAAEVSPPKHYFLSAAGLWVKSSDPVEDMDLYPMSFQFTPKYFGVQFGIDLGLQDGVDL